MAKLDVLQLALPNEKRKNFRTKNGLYVRFDFRACNPRAILINYFCFPYEGMFLDENRGKRLGKIPFEPMTTAIHSIAAFAAKIRWPRTGAGTRLRGLRVFIAPPPLTD